MPAEVRPFDLTAAAAAPVIREIAADSRRIVVTEHAKAQAHQRQITQQQIVRCCQLGTIREGPTLNSHGNWQVNLYRHAAGEEITCVVAIEWATRLIVITTFPEGR